MSVSDEGHSTFVSIEIVGEDGYSYYYVYDYDTQVQQWFILVQDTAGNRFWQDLDEYNAQSSGSTNDTPGSDCGVMPAGQPGSACEAPTDQPATSTAWTSETLVQFAYSNLDTYWSGWFAEHDLAYQTPQLYLNDDPRSPTCDLQGAFYCGAIYLDTDWVDGWLYDPGDFGAALVVAHEFGHHIENLLGWGYGTQTEQIAFELGGDCFAGVWANSTYFQGILEGGDVEEGQRLLLSLGDDYLGSSPDAYTHGTSRQRQASFMDGYNSGDPIACMSTG